MTHTGREVNAGTASLLRLRDRHMGAHSQDECVTEAVALEQRRLDDASLQRALSLPEVREPL